MTRNAVAACVDWGTSSFRLWLIDAAGQVLAARSSGDGIEQGGGQFSAILQNHLLAAGVAGDLPVIMCGMIGARQGWREIPYRDIPASLTALPRFAQPAGDSDHIRIMPGLAKRDPAHPNVMRGEETQLLGFCLDHPSVDGLVCLPGTHSKWAWIAGGTVTDFSTAVTGEIFALLTRHSVLRHLPAQAGEAATTQGLEFADGVRRGLHQPDDLLTALFDLRAQSLLFPERLRSPRQYLSGLLIGAEIASQTQRFDSSIPVTVIGEPGLAALYEAALGIAGYRCRMIDGAQAARRGLYFALGQIWPHRMAGAA